MQWWSAAAAAAAAENKGQASFVLQVLTATNP